MHVSASTRESTHAGTQAGTAARLAAAAAILVGGLVHLQLYFDGYRDFPNENLGRSFLLNGIASVVVAGALVVRRDWWVRLAGIGLVLGTIVAFALSRTDGGIFGFTETGLNPSPQGFLTVVTEVAALVLLAATFIPQLGAGRELRVPVALPLVGAALVGAVVMSVLWNQAPEDFNDPVAETGTTDSGSTGTASTDADTDTGTVTDSTAPGEEPAAEAPEVEINKFRFTPAELTVSVGDAVAWTNAEGVDHSVVADDDGFESERLSNGDAFEFTFDTAGTFAYICGLHPSMSGTVTVE